MIGYLSKCERAILDKNGKTRNLVKKSLIGDGHAERTFIEKKIFNLSLKHRQRHRWKVLPGQKMAWGKAEEEKTIHGLLNVAR